MPKPLWTFREIGAALAVTVPGDDATAVCGISIDTRTLQPGDLFVAVKGERSDGHDYIEAAAKSAGAALVSSEFASRNAGRFRLPLFVTDDPLEGLNQLARRARKRTGARVIGVTGSVGKTGAKEMLRLILGASGKVHVSEKSYNNLWGVPLSVARMPEETEFAAFEMGMNHANEIRPLTAMVRPHAAIITTVAPVHIEFFDSVAGIADAKAEIFEGVEAGGFAVLPADNEYFDRLAAHARRLGIEVVPFGANDHDKARLKSVKATGSGSLVSANIFGHEIEFTLGAPGRHLAANAVAALATAKLVGADLEAGAAALSLFEAPEGRGKRARLDTPRGAVLMIDETYNANPASMKAALLSLGDISRSEFPRKIAVLGDMLELGHGGPDYHRQLVESIDAADIDLVWCAGPLMSHLYSALPASKRGGWSETALGLEAPLREAIGGGDAVMVKGSLGMKMGQLAANLRNEVEKRCTQAA